MKQLARKILKDSKLKIVTSAGTEYSLPALWSLEDAGSYTFRNKLEDKAFSHGGNMTGDGKISGRTIKVEFLMMGATEQDHYYALNVAYTYFCQTDYELYVGRSDRKFRVAGVSKITHKYQKGYKQRWSQITVSLLLADPFRYEGRPTRVVKVEKGDCTEVIRFQNNPDLLVSRDSSLATRYGMLDGGAAAPHAKEEMLYQCEAPCFFDTLEPGTLETPLPGYELTLDSGKGVFVNGYGIGCKEGANA